jgi:hypothetical protein
LCLSICKTYVEFQMFWRTLTIEEADTAKLVVNGGPPAAIAGLLRLGGGHALEPLAEAAASSLLWGGHRVRVCIAMVSLL